MIAAIVLLAVAVVVLAAALAGSAVGARRDQAAWAVERQQLVNRVVARHTGEVIALDREVARPKQPKEPADPIHVVGLS